MDAYFINLEESTGRRNLMEQELRYRFDWERVEALMPSDLKKVLRVRQGLLEKYPRELAATCSHIKAIETARRMSDGPALILEDDVLLYGLDDMLLQEYIDDLPYDWDMLHLFGLQELYHKRLNGIERRQVVPMAEYPSYIASGYVISRRGMSKIAKHVAYTPDREMKINLFYTPDSVKAERYSTYELFNHRDDFWADHFLPCRLSKSYRTSMPLISIRGEDSTIQIDDSGDFVWYHKSHQNELKKVSDDFAEFVVYPECFRTLKGKFIL